MNQTEWIKKFQEEHDACVEISRAKNKDYATEEDGFANFRAGSSQGLDPALGIVYRMHDKMSRVTGLVLSSDDPAVKDEKIGDTLSDLANYALILKMLLEDK